MVRKADLLNCQFLKVGVNVEFECHVDKRGLIARNVKLMKSGHNNNGGGRNNQRNNQKDHNRNKDNHGNSANHDGYGYSKPQPFGVMT